MISFYPNDYLNLIFRRNALSLNSKGGKEARVLGNQPYRYGVISGFSFPISSLLFPPSYKSSN